MRETESYNICIWHWLVSQRNICGVKSLRRPHTVWTPKKVPNLASDMIVSSSAGMEIYLKDVVPLVSSSASANWMRFCPVLDDLCVRAR